MNNTSAASVSFAFASLLNPPAQASGYSSHNNFVTNSGLYNATVSEARFGNRMIKGEPRACIELRCVATHKMHPEHTGRLMLKIDVPNPSEPHASDYIYQSLCVAADIVETRQGPDGQTVVVPNFGEQVVTTSFAGDITQLTTLAGKRLTICVTRREYNGRGFLSASAIFDADGFSGRELATGAKAQGANPIDITKCDMAYEGLPLEPVQRSGASNQASSGFNAAPAPQAPQQAFAAPQGAFAAPQPPQAPQPAFAAPQAQPSPYAPAPQPAFGDDDRIPF